MIDKDYIQKNIIKIISIFIFLWGSFNLIQQLNQPFHYDFDAFRCAAQSTQSGHDPYLQEPLHACEASVGADLAAHSPVAIPAPQPPYIQTFFLTLLLIPREAMWVIWSLLSLSAAIFGAILLKKITNYPIYIGLATFSIPLWLPGAEVGAPATFSAVALVLTGWSIKEKKWNIAILGLLIASIQPNLAAPVWLALFLIQPEMRIRIGLSGIALLGLGCFPRGIHAWSEWVTQVLPIHALSEIGGFSQIGTASVLKNIGLESHLSENIAWVQWLLVVGLAIYVAKRQYNRNEKQWIVFLPMAAAAVGGTFLHVQDAAFAVPALLIYSTYKKSIPVYIALIMLSGCWFVGYDRLNLLPLVMAGPLLLIEEFLEAKIFINLLVSGTIAYAITSGHNIVMDEMAKQHVWDRLATLPHPSPDIVAGYTWGAYQIIQGSPGSTWFFKGITLLALTIIPWICLKILTQSDKKLSEN